MTLKLGSKTHVNPLYVFYIFTLLAVDFHVTERVPRGISKTFDYYRKLLIELISR